VQQDLGFFFSGLSVCGDFFEETTESWRFGEGRRNGAEWKQSSDKALSLEALSL
jgi:hypothetical protein